MMLKVYLEPLKPSREAKNIIRWTSQQKPAIPQLIKKIRQAYYSTSAAVMYRTGSARCGCLPKGLSSTSPTHIYRTYRSSGNLKYLFKKINLRMPERKKLQRCHRQDTTCPGSLNLNELISLMKTVIFRKSKWVKSLLAWTAKMF